MQGHFSSSECEQLTRYAIDHGLIRASLRAQLLVDLTAEQRAYLPEVSTPAEQIYSDVVTLNAMTTSSGEPLLTRWRARAEALVADASTTARRATRRRHAWRMLDEARFLAACHDLDIDPRGLAGASLHARITHLLAALDRADRGAEFDAWLEEECT